jgi:hypothetical protein
VLTVWQVPIHNKQFSSGIGKSNFKQNFLIERL